MPVSLVERIMRRIGRTGELYYRLVLVAAPAGGGKTLALREVGDRMGAAVVNVNLELSRRMLNLTARKRALRLPRLIREITENGNNELILLDNIEILFDVGLKQDPLRLLQGISRNTTVVASWNGGVSNGDLTYAAPEHPEFRRYPVRDFLVVTGDWAA